MVFKFVAAGLNRAGLGTLLFDLLTEEEEIDRANVFVPVVRVGCTDVHVQSRAVQRGGEQSGHLFDGAA
ncbi:hypothetical protein [Streptomyces sp. NPDC059970]|uniref:hypothetical protein n=1 Tax=Streptomyces sp. NPDC059970 TaxID=3347019 RepID=UPI0036C335A8